MNATPLPPADSPAEIRADRSSRAFILADAKDADMAFGVRAPGAEGP